MKIALFSEVYWPMVSGVSLTLQRLRAAMTARGHEIRVYAPQYPTPAGASPSAEVHSSPAMPLFLYPDVRWAFPRGPDVTADFQAFEPDLVHVATEFAMGQAGLRLARRFEVPVVASAHTDYERYASRYRLEWLMSAGWRYLRHFYGQANMVLVPSRVYENHLHARGIRHTKLWTRGVDARRFSPAHRSTAFRAELGLAEETQIVLHVGRLAVEKNLHLLLEAWRQIEAVRGDARLVLVGEGPMRESIASGGHTNVILAGMRLDDALGEAYASADLFAFPSSTETFGNVLLEAMASRLPCLAVAAGGVLDFAEHDQNAWLVVPDDVNALAGGLTGMFGDRALCRRLAEGAVNTAKERSWDRIFDALEGDYATASHRRRGAAVV